MPKNTPLPMQWLTVDGQNVPIVLPDHWDDDKKEWKTTGTGNPLPIANYTQNASGVWLPTSESNPVPTRVTGRNVDEIEMLSGLALTDTSNKTTPEFDFSAYKEMTFIVTNTTDVDVRFRVQINGNIVSVYQNREWVNTALWENHITIPSNTPRGMIGNDFLPVAYSGFYGKNVRFVLNAMEIPTIGSVSVYAWGSRR